jgi:hypothetical protein
MPKYVATLRAVYEAEDDVGAVFIADQIRVNGERDLDDEDGDVLDVTQVTSNQLDLTPEETITQLRRARNLLVKTRIKECYNLAKELDQQIYALSHRSAGEFAMAGYDFADFMDLAQSILVEGVTPDV